MRATDSFHAYAAAALILPHIGGDDPSPEDAALADVLGFALQDLRAIRFLLTSKE